ncbi:MAG: UDP-N-acetylmuramoyl-tripeptide--D-alanyl-D-alanine ligase [Lachnospiraceae bacterium]|nr:UDP-N-acetylmuramoyl-tripeptide--D-alanyl-D-alanine ligase [Lachnospiraceae bacterium]
MLISSDIIQIWRKTGLMDNISIKDVIDALGAELYYGDSSRVKDVFINNVTSDSREVKENTLFLCIKGERVNGHDFLPASYEKGAVCAFISENVDTSGYKDDIYLIKTEDVIKAVQTLALWYRRKFDIPVIGVTGSVGKTTTKEMTACALAAGKKVLKTIGNRNSQLGVALMMFELSKEFDIAVIEMGISESGEMDRLTHIAEPEAAIVTNIGVSHIANLKSRENICKEKLSITNGFSENGGVLYVCGNDDMLNVITKESELVNNTAEVISYGTCDNCNVKAVNIENDNDTVSFDVYINEKTVHVTLNVTGLHNVCNAVTALLLADRYGVDVEAAAEALSEYRPMAMRGERFTFNNAIVIDDTYNASPDSIKSILNVLWDMKCTGKKYAVLADVLELGEMSKELHTEIGSYINNMNDTGRKTDVLITFGKNAAFIADKVREHGKCEVYSFDNRDDITKLLKENLGEGDVCIIKGSRGMKMDEIIKGLK